MAKGLCQVPFCGKGCQGQSVTCTGASSSMASFLPVLILFFITGGAMSGSWVFTPKGPQQVYAKSFVHSYALTHFCNSLIRTSLLLTFACCYIMWAITYMAQLHPLVGKLLIYLCEALKSSQWCLVPIRNLKN